jgi:hypothetical protein
MVKLTEREKQTLVICKAYTKEHLANPQPLLSLVTKMCEILKELGVDLLA